MTFAWMTSTPNSLLARLWVYQAERFPIFRTGVLLAVFISASINASAHLAGRLSPGIGAYLVAFVVTLILFFHLRACDEIKDAEDDLCFRPERPIPRGLVTLKLIVGIAIGMAALAIAVTASYQAALLIPLILAWTWLGLMTAEFFVGEWLKDHPLFYLVSHMLIMPLIDLFVTACEWIKYENSPPTGVWLFLALSFANGCVLEIGRKLYAPANERVGVETYSSIYGVRKATVMWIVCIVVAYALLVGVGFGMGYARFVGPIGAVAFVIAVSFAIAYLMSPTVSAQKRMDDISGLWVLICYALAGFAPLLARVLP